MPRPEADLARRPDGLHHRATTRRSRPPSAATATRRSPPAPPPRRRRSPLRRAPAGRSAASGDDRRADSPRPRRAAGSPCSSPPPPSETEARDVIAKLEKRSPASSAASSPAIRKADVQRQDHLPRPRRAACHARRRPRLCTKLAGRRRPVLRRQELSPPSRHPCRSHEAGTRLSALVRAAGAHSFLTPPSVARPCARPDGRSAAFIAGCSGPAAHCPRSSPSSAKRIRGG